MKTLVTHIILTLVIGYLFFSHTPYQSSAINATIVCGIIFLLLWLSSFIYQRSYFRKLPKAFVLLLYFSREFIVANLRIAHDILTLKYHMQPTLVALPLTVRSDFEITVLACIITLTPGTLSLDLSPDRKILYMHSLYVPKGGIAVLKQDIKDGFERRIMELIA